MQDPEHTRGTDASGVGMPEGPGTQVENPQHAAKPASTPAITIDEEAFRPEHKEHNGSHALMIASEAARKVRKAGGTIEETENPDGVSTTIITLPDENKKIILTTTSIQGGISRKIQVIVEGSEQAKGPYQGNCHGRQVDDRKRVFWPARWKNNPPTIAMYNPRDRSMKIIFTDNPNTKIPKGWQIATVENGTLLFGKTGKKGEETSRITLSRIFGRDKKKFQPQKVDFYGHDRFATMVSGRREDIDETILAQIN